MSRDELDAMLDAYEARLSFWQRRRVRTRGWMYRNVRPYRAWRRRFGG